MHTWTDTPLTAIWQHLRYLKSPANAERILTGLAESGRTSAWSLEDAKRSAPQLSACIAQADEYFHASQGVGLATKPLLQFYGAQSLAKAVIIASDPTLTLADLKYHGLNTRPATASGPDRTILQSYVDDPSAWTLEDEFAVTHEGVFRHLSIVAGDAKLSQGHVLRFKELLRIIPDLSKLFARHYREPSHCIYLYSGPDYDAGKFRVYFSVEDRKEVVAVFPEFQNGFSEVEMHDYPGFESTTDGEPQFGAVENGALAGRYFVRPLASGTHSALPTLFAAMFILSNVVRYKPAFWMRIIEGRTSGSGSVAEALCDLFERHFSNLVLEQIWGERFTYGGPAYVS